MINTVLNVEGMSCSHCVNAVTKAVGALDGVSAVQVDLEGKTVSVEHDAIKCPVDKIQLEIEEQGYDII